jgi:hypothetical protein
MLLGLATLTPTYAGYTMPNYRRCREKFHAALYRLAVAEGDVRERLRGVYRYFQMLSEEEVPPNLRQEWLEILQALTYRGPEPGPDGTVYKNALNHTLSRMKNGTGRRIAERVYALVQEID